MDREYKFQLTTPGGSSEASADSLADLAVHVPAGVVNGVRPKADDPPQRDLESVAKEALESLRSYQLETGTRTVHTVFSDAGLELALIKCYLRGITVHGALDWLQGEHDFTCSKSAVGRYWRRLWESGVVQLGDIVATQTQTTL